MVSIHVVHVNDHVPGAIYIGRSMPRRKIDASPFANPFKITPKRNRQHVIWDYNYYLIRSGDLLTQLPTLRGATLACWCRHAGQDRIPETVCHGDVIGAILEHYSDDQLWAMNLAQWISYDWPAWIPEEIAAQIEEFWLEAWHRGPREWLRNSYRQGAPRLGEVVTLPTLSGDGQTATGRYVHCWNNIGRIVHDDGSWDYVGFHRPQAPAEWFATPAREGEAQHA